ncbi:helix-turn-helix transcriptional regulator [Marinobacterium sedimentorum]|uniref:helix-turn-helix transcriptional regulator n=1 Tax=Marinobacterium sedimentorum TaxID=2927804 RepID=UPI0020C689B7|nr:AlpA family transcriptional regulator [Marinobacterium sedimentorum]MCP8687173.1 AlpA family transcriptional regulator [Marinobacterium sedimentorum]
MRLLRLPEVLYLTAQCRSSVYRKIKEGTFPASVGLGANSVAWVEEEVLAWIQARIDERDQPDIR